MSLSRRVTGGAALQLGARLFSSAVALVVTAVVLARTLPEAEYGRFCFYLTLYLLTMSLVDFGVNKAAIRLVAAGEETRGEVIDAAIRLKAIAGAAAFLIMSVLALVAEDGLGTRVGLVIAALHALGHGFGAASIGFEVDVRFRVPAQSVVIGQAVFLLGGLALALGSVDEASPYLIAWGSGLVVQNLWMWSRWRAVEPGKASRLDSALVRRLIREAAPLGLSAVAVAIYYYTDTLMLRPIHGEEEVAQYSTAYRLMGVGLMVPVLFSQVLFPVFTRCRQRGGDMLASAVHGASFYLALLATVGSVVLFSYAPEWLELVFGAPYRDAAPALRVVAVAMACVYLTYPHTTALIAIGRAADFTRITVVAAVLNVALNLAVLPTYGVVGAAATTLATEAFVLVASIWFLHRRVGFTGLSRRLLGPAALAAILAFTIHGPLEEVPWGLAIVATVGIGAVAAVLMSAFPFSLGVDEALLETE